MRKFVAVFLLLSLLVSISACGGGDNAETSITGKPDEEILRAISYGLIAEENWKNTDKTITHKELCELITHMVALRGENFVPVWEDVARLALQSDELVHRDDAILALFEAAIVMGTDREFFGNISDDWEGALFTGDDWWEGASHDYPLFPNWEEPYQDDYDGNKDYSIFDHSAWYFENIISAVSWTRPFEPTENYTYDFGREVSVEEAVRAVTRYTESVSAILAPDPVYVKIAEVGTYDKSIITDELLNAPSDFPEVTQQVLPSSWKGMGLTKRKDGHHTYRAFVEEDIAFLAENGFNFLRLFYGFETMRYPDYPQDSGVVNENELKDLDQLLAWCMEYGVHLQISMNRFFDEDGHSIWGQEGHGFEGMLPASEAAWQVNADHWAMLAKRYVGIDSKYLTFDLINEVQPQDSEEQAILDAAVAGMKTVVDAVRNQDSERVLLVSNPGEGNLAWNQAIAKMGVAIACHPYYPDVISTGGNGADYLSPVWPMPALHLHKFTKMEQPLTIQGAIGGATLTLYVNMYYAPSQLEIYADGVLLERVTMSGGELVDAEWNGYSLNEPLTFALPENTQTVELLVIENSIHLGTLAVEGSAGCTVITPVSDEGHYVDIPPITICDDGSYIVGNGIFVTEDDIYKNAIAPLQRIAIENDVGFMVSEFGTFADTEWDISVVAAYTDTMIQLLEEHNISWCFCELYNCDTHLLVEFPGTSSCWKNATMVDASPEGFTMQKQAVKEFLDVFWKYTLPDEVK